MRNHAYFFTETKDAMDLTVVLDQVAKGVTIGSAAFTAFVALARWIGQPILYWILNGRYETKAEAIAAHASTTLILHSIEERMRISDADLTGDVAEMRQDVREIRAAILGRHSAGKGD